MGLFEAPNTIGVILTEIVKPLGLDFQLIDKVIAYVKTKGFKPQHFGCSFVFNSYTCPFVACKTFCKFLFWPRDVKSMPICNK